MSAGIDLRGEGGGGGKGAGWGDCCMLCVELSMGRFTCYKSVFGTFEKSYY